MARQLTDILRANQLMRHYLQNKRVGNEEFHVLLPIVSEAQNTQGVPRRAIKPLDLDRGEPTKIYDHGDTWITRMKRLRQVSQLPEEMLFTIREPLEGDKRIKACHEIRKELENLNLHVQNFGNDNAVLEFARL